METRNLRCEYLVNPLGLGVREPRLSWEIADPRRGAAQTAYRILVAATEENLAADRGDLWDSGIVKSGETSQIVYGGRPLASRMRCHWKVRVFDAAAAQSPWSRPAFWTMGLLEMKDWRARWIGYDGAPGEEERARPDLAGAQWLLPCPHLRCTFRVEKPVRRATLYASALGLYEMHLNGRRVGDDLFTPGWTDYRKRIYYNTYDVTAFLCRCENALGGILARGWYGLRGRYGKELRLLAQLEIEFADGATQVVATGPAWKGASGPLLAADNYDGETFDARREMPGWDAPGFSDSGWRPVVPGGAVKAELGAYPSATVRRFEEIKAVAVAEPRPGVFVFDFGQNFSGIERLKVNGRAGTTVVMRFAEVLEPDGNVHTANLRSARCTDAYTLRGDPAGEAWEPRFTFHGYRYVEVTGYPGMPPLDAVTGIVVHSDLPRTGSFECSNPLVNRLWRNITWTQRGNFIDVPTDCPQRDERMGWTGDAQVFIRTATYNMDAAAFFTKWQVDLADAQKPDGGFTDVAPVSAFGGSGTAAWGDAGVICPWTIHTVYGDKRILESHYPTFVRWVEYLEEHSTDLLRPAAGYGDWVPAGAETPKDVIATAYFARSTRIVARIARAIGKEGDAAKFEALFHRIKEAFNKAYVAEDGRVNGDTQTCYAMALLFDLLPEGKRAAAAARLASDIEARGWHVSVGFVGVASLLPALTAIGRTDVAYRLLEQETYPSWLYPVRHGATSIWERWNGWTAEKGLHDPAMNSFAHYAYGCVGEWLYSTVAGIETNGPGYRRIIIRPRPGGTLTYAKASYRSINGEIVSAWRLDGARLEMDVTIPANTTATIHVPAKDAAGVTEGGKPAAGAEGLEFLRMEEGAAVYRAGSGTYRFEAPTK